jgi:hypothetical protein
MIKEHVNNPKILSMLIKEKNPTANN